MAGLCCIHSIQQFFGQCRTVTTASNLRKEFLNYFKQHGHTIVESSSLVPHNDPTLLFTNAGMVQFKDVFLGLDPRPYKRATTAQKCVRAGGKHNDLENVGRTARHHTFFEMLGNFSFGDYFKKEAIHFAWEFVTKNLNLPKKLLYVSVYKDDDDAAAIWEKEQSVPRDHIYRFGEKDNFWSMGETGPCGPCSEIFIDRGEEFGCKKSSCSVGCDCDRFMEFWNLVFMQFNRDSSGALTPLPKPSVDTGMGLERVASVLQGVASNYETDLFQNLIQTVGALAKVQYGKNEKQDISFRVIADHCRATNFLIADGVLPSNEGRGYVLRRIMRRAIRHGKKLNFNEPFFYKLTSTLISHMADAYPDIKDKQSYLESTIQLEEERFFITLENGLSLLEEEFKKTTTQLSGKAAFMLYDTFGFPLDLTQVIAQEKGFEVDVKAFEEQMHVQKQRSREHWKGSGEIAVLEVYKDLVQKGLKTNFVGYDSLVCKGKVLALLEEGKLVSKSSTGSFELVLDQTPFYAESGGQVGDRGELFGSNSFHAKVSDAQKPTGDFIVLSCHEAQGQIEVGSVVEQRTNENLRSLTAKNHTATHMLHAALRKILGDHVKQAGSLVAPDLLRFDFTHTKPLSENEIEQVEDFINLSVSKSELVLSEQMEKEKALKKGAIAFFGEKYGSQVRVVQVGSYSTELCGGTHIKNTAEVQNFKILNESGIAAGVRRILAITGPTVVQVLREKEKLIQDIMVSLKASAPPEILIKIQKLQNIEKEMKKTLEVQTRKLAITEVDHWISQSIHIKDGKLICAVPELPTGVSPAKALRDLVDIIRSKVERSIIALGAKDPDKDQVLFLIAVTKDWTNTYNASELIKKIAPLLEGTGGGKPELAQAGGKKEKFVEAFQTLKEVLCK